MSKNQILYRIGLWIFLFTLIGSIIFAFLQGRNPEFLDPNIFYATVLGFISSATIMIFYAYFNQQAIAEPIEQQEEIPHGNFSGTLDETWLPAGYGIIYENAWGVPVISIYNSGGRNTTIVDFDNGKVIINSVGNTAEILKTKGEIKIIVRFIDETKISFGY